MCMLIKNEFNFAYLLYCNIYIEFYIVYYSFLKLCLYIYI